MEVWFLATGVVQLLEVLCNSLHIWVHISCVCVHWGAGYGTTEVQEVENIYPFLLCFWLGFWWDFTALESDYFSVESVCSRVRLPHPALSIMFLVCPDKIRLPSLLPPADIVLKYGSLFPMICSYDLFWCGPSLCLRPGTVSCFWGEVSHLHVPCFCCLSGKGRWSAPQFSGCPLHYATVAFVSSVPYLVHSHKQS